MPPASFRVNIVVDAPPETVFPYVSDLTRHGEWSSDPVDIRAMSAGPIAVGSRYRSTARSHGATFTTELVVTRYELPACFAFEGEDATGKFRHIFTFQLRDGVTLVTREIRFSANLGQWLVFFLVLYPVRLPSARRTLQLLKQKVEGDLRAKPPA